MRKFLLVLVFCCLALSPFKVFSTHIVGGEMYYEYVGSDQYKITLYVYRDCFNGIPPFDNPGYIAIFDSSWTRIMNLTPAPAFPDTIPLENYDSCTWVDTVCYEITKYEVTATLPPKEGGYYLAYDRCCWNHSVFNIVKPDERGLTVLTHIPDSLTAYGNSSPVFNKRTPVFFCVDRFFEFDHSASDPDGDSLVYELFTPLNSSRMWDSHLAPLPGPYNDLIYTPGYSLNNVFGGTVPLKIDPQSGLLTTTHGNEIGQYVFGVKVKEYRDGLYIGESTRTYQINSQQCRRYTRAKFTSPIIQCGDSVVTFVNNSDSAVSYLWHFGDNNSVDSISNSEGPTHRYSGMGNFQVTLIAYSHQGNKCNDTTSGAVQLYPNIVGEFIHEDEKCNNYVQFNDITNSPSGPIIKWQWNFGDGSGASVASPLHHYNLTSTPRSYLVTLYVLNDKGCEDSVMQIYSGVNRKYNINDISAKKYIVYPRDDSTLLVVDADSAVSYEWSPSEGLSNPSGAKTYASPKTLTNYKVIVKDGRGCTDEADIEIDVHEYSCGETVVYIPNAFSPNGDGENDYLRVRGEEIRALRLSIYNRWGQLVFESNNPNMTEDVSLGWDGKLNGELQDPGVYVYTLDARCSDGREFSKKGNITLLR